LDRGGGLKESNKETCCERGGENQIGQAKSKSPFRDSASKIISGRENTKIEVTGKGGLKRVDCQSFLAKGPLRSKPSRLGRLEGNVPDGDKRGKGIRMEWEPAPKVEAAKNHHRRMFDVLALAGSVKLFLSFGVGLENSVLGHSGATRPRLLQVGMRELVLLCI